MGGVGGGFTDLTATKPASVDTDSAARKSAAGFIDLTAT